MIDKLNNNRNCFRPKNGKHEYLDSYRYFKNNKLHREDGPAIEWNDGDRWWFYNGLKHREDGPAISLFTGYKEYWYHGVKIDVSSDDEFKRVIKMKVFI